MLDENQITGKWTNRRICLGGKDLCHSGVTGNLGSNILSFGEDDAGISTTLFPPFQAHFT